MTKVVTPKAVKPPTIGSLIDAVKKLAEQRSKLSAEDKALKAQQDDLEAQIITMLDEQETRVGEGKLAKASITESEVPTVEDWDKFFAWATRTKNTHLIQHHISSPAWREMRALKNAELPGIKAFTKRSLSIRAV